LYFLYEKYKMENRVHTYIPFLPKNISEEDVKNILRNQGFGEVMNIKIYTKKYFKKQNPHFRYYAFIDIHLFITTMGNNMKHNLQNNKTTHVMFNKNNFIEHIDIKRYLSLEERINKGYNTNNSFINSKHFVELDKEMTKLLCL